MRALVQRVSEASVRVEGEVVGAIGRGLCALVDHVAAALRDVGVTVATGRFRTTMAVSLVNDGPVTLLLEL